MMHKMETTPNCSSAPIEEFSDLFHMFRLVLLFLSFHSLSCVCCYFASFCAHLNSTQVVSRSRRGSICPPGVSTVSSHGIIHVFFMDYSLSWIFIFLEFVKPSGSGVFSLFFRRLFLARLVILRSFF